MFGEYQHVGPMHNYKTSVIYQSSLKNIITIFSDSLHKLGDTVILNKVQSNILFYFPERDGMNSEAFYVDQYSDEAYY
jgi:hypothetical protein